MSKQEATRLADALGRAFTVYGVFEPSPREKVALEAADLLRRWPDGEPDEERIGASIYRGNTVSYMYSKAKAYGDTVLSLWGMLAEAGYKATGENHVKDMLARCIETARTQSERIAALEAALEQARVALRHGIKTINHLGGAVECMPLHDALRAIEEVRRG